MRLHVIYQGNKTTISIEDQLVEYLGALLVKNRPEWHGDAKVQLDIATGFIRDNIFQVSKLDHLPTKNISQYVRSRIITWIAEPVILEIIDIRGDPAKKRTRPKENTTQRGSVDDVEKAYEELKKIMGR